MVHFRSGEGYIITDLSYKIIQFPPGGAKYGAQHGSVKFSDTEMLPDLLDLAQQISVFGFLIELRAGFFDLAPAFLRAQKVLVFIAEEAVIMFLADWGEESQTRLLQMIRYSLKQALIRYPEDTRVSVILRDSESDRLMKYLLPEAMGKMCIQGSRHEIIF